MTGRSLSASSCHRLLAHRYCNSLVSAADEGQNSEASICRRYCHWKLGTLSNKILLPKAALEWHWQAKVKEILLKVNVNYCNLLSLFGEPVGRARSWTRALKGVAPDLECGGVECIFLALYLVKLQTKTPSLLHHPNASESLKSHHLTS